MAATLLFTGPIPPRGTMWCFACTAAAKNAAINDPDQAAAIKAANEAPEGSKTVRLKIDPRAELAEAVGYGIFFPMMQLGPVPLCWTHITGIGIQNSALLPASAADMPAGVPLLGQGRR